MTAMSLVRQLRLGMAQAVEAGDTQTAQQLAAALENMTAA